jgi:hypothetical protein
MRAGFSFDQLRSDADPVAGPCADCLRGHSARPTRGRPASRRRRGPCRQGRVAGDHEQFKVGFTDRQFASTGHSPFR